MAVITVDWGAGGLPIVPHGSSGVQPTLATFARDVADDLAALRTAIIAVCAQLDLDGGVIDETYEENNTPAAMATQKG
jgi:hypothetical protein